LSRGTSPAKVVAMDGMDDEAIQAVFPLEKPEKKQGRKQPGISE